MTVSCEEGTVQAILLTVEYTMNPMFSKQRLAEVSKTWGVRQRRTGPHGQDIFEKFSLDLAKKGYSKHTCETYRNLARVVFVQNLSPKDIKNCASKNLTRNAVRKFMEWYTK